MNFYNGSVLPRLCGYTCKLAVRSGIRNEGGGVSFQKFRKTGVQPVTEGGMEM